MRPAPTSYAAADDLPRGAGAPLSRPAVLISSSISGQWIPNPPPALLQLARCAGVACRRRGYHAKGTMIVRPSNRSTLSESSVTRTSFTRSPALGSEVFMPGLQKHLLMLNYQRLDPTEFLGTRTKIVRQGNRVEPKLHRVIIPVYMDMRGLVRLMTVEVEPIRTIAKDRWTQRLILQLLRHIRWQA